MKLLLVEPAFPVPDKSRNHAHWLPVGLLKIASYHARQGDKVKVVRGIRRCGFTPDRVLITSVFTYWSESVHAAAAYYHKSYPTATIEIGGIYASLMPENCRRRSPFAAISVGLYRGGVAEGVPVDFTLLPEPLDYQVIHTTRGCTRRCAFCGTWRIEPQFTFKQSITDEIQKPNLVFYDNNLLANPHIDDILRELARHRLPRGRRVTCESQSGLDLRLLTVERAQLLKEARFQNPRIAWDGGYEEWPSVRRTVMTLKQVGYGRKDIFVFMLYNHNLRYREMRKKLDACRRWQVRVIDCRFRPLTATSDGYRPGPIGQRPGEYYIHPGWIDREVREFRRLVREQNIAILLGLPDGRYIPGCEQAKVAVNQK